MPPARLSLARRIGYSLFLTVSLLIAGEGITRAFVYNVGQASIPDGTVQEHVRTGVMRYDPDYFWVWDKLPQPEMNIDQNAFRWKEPVKKEKDPGVFRAFSLGDSQTYGAGLRWDRTYSAVAEARLNEGRARVEVVNAGISGYGSLQALRLIELKLPDWAPDLVIVDCPTHDQPTETRGPRTRGVQGKIEAVLFESRLYYLMRFTYDRLNGRTAHMRQDRGEFDRENTGNQALILERATHMGIQVVFLDYPFWDERYDSLAHLAPLKELPEGAVYVDSLAALKASGKPNKQLFLDNNHLSETGARIVGEALAQVVAPLVQPQ